MDVVVIGTGFCASNLTSFLEQNSLTIQVIEPSSEQSPIVFTKTTGSVFSEDQANKTAGLGGGKSVWGKAITHPNDKNWFVSKGNIEWESLYARLNTVVLPSEMNIPRANHGSSSFVKTYFPNLEARFHEEIGLYAGNELGDSNNFSLPQFDQNSLMHATVLELRAHPSNYLVTSREKSGLIIEIECKYLVLASGTFLNACLSSLISGQKDFPLSNHFDADFGSIALARPIIVKDGVQTYASGEKAFSTFTSLPLTQNAAGEPNTSIRLQANPILIGRKRMVAALLKLEFHFLFTRIIPYLFSTLTGSPLVENLVVRVIADQNISEKNRMRVLSFHDGIFHIEISLKIEESVSSHAYRVVNEFMEMITSSKIVRGMELVHEDEILWNDPAHYFGTTPIGLHQYDSSLTSDSESSLYPGLYIIGNSSLPVGSHGHPTLIAMQLSIIAAMKIVSSEKGR